MKIGTKTIGANQILSPKESLCSIYSLFVCNAYIIYKCLLFGKFDRFIVYVLTVNLSISGRRSKPI